ncbi:hypothetical protein [Rhodococcus zopfii]|uniref:hypothetical protein n=1 Tax=Rhodococcus zopfii TaxID=43772 RepID=UPI001486AD69|nr:hypothetical protein [Rhodococcus zopfii]
MTAPTRREVEDFLAALTDEELADTIAAARRTTAGTPTIRSAHRKEMQHASRH